MKNIPLLFLGAAALILHCNDERQEIYRELNSPAVARRAGAVRVLWRVGDQEAYRLATGALDDDSPVVRLAAVRALADFKHIDTFKALVRASRNQDKSVRRLAAEKIAASGRPESRNVLLDLLALHEREAENRSLLARLLRQSGLSFEEQSRETSARLVKSWLADWPRTPLAQRAKIAALAACLADERALDVVRLALADGELEVVEAALSYIDGRGGTEITRLLARIYSDSPTLRENVLQEFGRRGAEGREFILGALYSADHHTRKAALGLLEANSAEPPLMNQAGAVAVCPSEEYLRQLLDAPAATTEALPDISTVPLDAAVVEKFLQQLPTGDARLVAATYFLIKGVAAPSAVSLVDNRLKQLISQLRIYREDWIAGRILPLKSDQQSQSDKGPPRTASDLLARFPTRQEASYYRRLFPALAEEFDEELVRLARARLSLRPADGARLLEELLRAPSAEIVARAAQLALDLQLRVEIGPELRENLTLRLNEADGAQAEAIGKLMFYCGDPQLVRAVLAEMKNASWEKNRRLILALEGELPPEAQKALEEQLDGENSSAVALVLARAGRRDLAPKFRGLLEKCVGEARLELLEALALSQDKSILSEIETYLFDLDPNIRLRALDIAGKLKGVEAGELLKLARWDIDRRVRQKALDIIEAEKQP